MATPLPQTDNGLPGRTAFQPALPNGPAAGGEKTLTGEMEARKPIPLERPAPRHAPASTFASVAAVAKDDRGAGPEAPTSTDWGLAPKKLPLVTKLKALVALGTLAASVGGYFAFNRYFSKDTQGVADIGEVADSDAPNQSNSALDGRASDPFGDSLTSEIDQDPQATANSEPRKIRVVPDAVPIATSRRANGRSPKKPPRNTLSLDDEPLDVDDDSDDSAPPRLTQSEPDFDGDATSGPALDGPAGTPRRNGAAGHAASRSQNAAHPNKLDCVFGAHQFFVPSRHER